MIFIGLSSEARALISQKAKMADLFLWWLLAPI